MARRGTGTGHDRGQYRRIASRSASASGDTRHRLLRQARSGIDFDGILERLPFEEEVIARSELRDIGGLRVRLPQVEDLLIMEAIAQRPQDLRDTEGLLDAHPEANVERFRQIVREFASSQAMPKLLENFERLLTLRKPKRTP